MVFRIRLRATHMYAKDAIIRIENSKKRPWMYSVLYVEQVQKEIRE